MSSHRRGGHLIPGPNYEGLEIVEVGPPTYRIPMPGIPGIGVPKSPASERPRSNVALVPTPDEVAALPKLAREAFAARCEQRVPPGAVDATTHVAAAVAQYLFATATTDTPLTAQLRCIRRDLTRLRTLARKGNWADDTPVPPDALGPLWPDGVAPHWAAEAPR
ncbi:hypothetical protein [Gemmata sp.]|uniref:hypothetical protein n=1 Tax=Gemmata sp. TaxID=1914242 RepID=UPI003F6FD56A